MSSEIVYDKQFIKIPRETEDEFIPMLYWGSSNCYDWSPSGRERRSRDWNVWRWHTNGKWFATRDEILNHVEQFRQDKKDENAKRNAEYRAKGEENWIDDWDDSRFGYWSSIAIGGTTLTTTFGRYKGLFNTGIKKALTVEELREEGINVWISSYLYGSDYKALGVEPFSETPSTTQELLDLLEEAEARFKDVEGVSIHMSINASENTMKWLRKRRFTRVKKETEETKLVYLRGFWTFKAPKGGYFHKFTRNGYRYSYQTPKYKFVTEAEANKALSKSRRSRGVTVEFTNTEAYVSLTLSQIQEAGDRVIRYEGQVNVLT